ncbi:hypothetical protein GE21DRAFT_1979 [Neurospora crassa]|uniref:Adenylyltransferase and sulfurtransferase uba4 n=1 Tax=Neurospora crassa (strain ATCC 24698 / 74-OR23-1A / CBS 708.71 / DSM 1257 / FGSC 987) TaxID=367110 RepID=Q7SEE2_NEUCR|nr:molybdenum cofactor biosynthetic protein [Neurospora crassa OR74A]EAA35153.1 molybdenum cofactor biosynthetic protein [Neurospora crassa OR74A]KHE89710.1 hypothetical protein GE21DRAFT_1979 [Neurospora crassa]|eukprot:XP_964389.1 molybdenum cofactor biosynthetic protein [Neurospora crassa OR74A]
MQNGGASSDQNGSISSVPRDTSRPLTEDELDRYSRQMIVPGMGKEAQLRLINAKVLIIGAGGLGCPAAQYIAGAGIGTIGIADGDTVERSNLHRQVGHSTSRIGQSKVSSLITHLRGLNPLPTYVAHTTHITPLNAADLISQYDLILDCTDNPATRYLISDVCVLLCKPLVSAASVQTSGQIIVLNCPPTPQGQLDGGPYPPCYRCCFKKPPPANAQLSCGEAGILGPVVGLMGVAQAGEAIKILASALHIPTTTTTTTSPPAQGVPRAAPVVEPTLLLYSYSLTSFLSPFTFRALKMAPRKKNCFACGEGSKQRLTLEGVKNGEPNYDFFCGLGGGGPEKGVLSEEERITPREFVERVQGKDGNGKGKKYVVLDTREKEHFSFGSIEGAVNLPFGKLLSKAAQLKRSGETPKVGDILPPEIQVRDGHGDKDIPIYVVCRRGLDSQEAVEKLKEMGLDNGGSRKIVDIAGGMKAWKEQVDPSFPYL